LIQENQNVRKNHQDFHEEPGLALQNRSFFP